MLIIKTLLLHVLITSAYGYPLAIKSHKQRDTLETMIYDLSKVLADCKIQRLDNIGILTHSNSSSVRWSAKFLARSTVINLKDTRREGQFAWDSYRRRLRHKLHTFIIVASSLKNLRHLIGELKGTIWWNTRALFVLIDNQSLRTGCRNSYRYLRWSWDEDLLSSTYLCHDGTKGLTMFTYNPFTPKAPYPWEAVMTNTMNRQNHSWTMFKQQFRRGRTTCEDLDYNRETDLGGFPLNVLAMQNHATLIFNLKIQEHGALRIIGGIDGMMARMIFPKLNVTLNILPVAKQNESHYEQVASGELDMTINSVYMFNKPNYTMTYPHMDSGLSILTRYPGNEAEYTKILKFMNPKLLLGLLLVFAGTIIILTVFARVEIIASTFEVLRIVFGVSLLNTPTGNPMRIYLITVIVLFMLTASIFQSSLSSLLTSPVPKATIDTELELKESGFPLYVPYRYVNAIYDSVVHSRTIPTNDFDCSQYVINQSDVACAMDSLTSQKIALDNDLYVSEHRLTTVYCAYVVRPTWSLLEKLNSILNVAYQSGLSRYWYRRDTEKYRHKVNRMKAMFKKKEYRIMQLEDLDFAFYILLIGNTVAFLVFLVEICYARYAKMNKIKNVNKLPVFPFTL